MKEARGYRKNENYLVARLVNVILGNMVLSFADSSDTMWGLSLNPHFFYKRIITV